MATSAYTLTSSEFPPRARTLPSRDKVVAPDDIEVWFADEAQIGQRRGRARLGPCDEVLLPNTPPRHRPSPAHNAMESGPDASPQAPPRTGLIRRSPSLGGVVAIESFRSQFPILRHHPSSEPLSAGETAWKSPSVPRGCAVHSGLGERNERPNLSPNCQFSLRPGAMGVLGPSSRPLK